jgi:preprotein translocase subunit SecG
MWSVFSVVTAVIIIDLIVCVLLTAIVVVQSGKTSGLAGALGGGSDTFLAKNKAKTLDAKLSRGTKWVAVTFIVLTLVLNIIIK